VTGGPSLRQRLLESWRALRESDRLGTLLPRCISRSYGATGEGFGFATVDYRIYRDVALGFDRVESGLEADLIEMYWSVRTRGGKQDPQWAAAVNGHVVMVTEGALNVKHLERLYRQVVSLRLALQLGGIGDLTAAGKPVALHARGLLLGSSLSRPVAIVDALANHADVPLTVGRYGVGPGGEFEFSSSGDESRFYLPQDDTDHLRAVGERFLHHDRLFQTQGIWQPGAAKEWAGDRRAGYPADE
jgi:hypothetical protein